MGAVTPFATRLAAKELALVGSAAGRLSRRLDGRLHPRGVLDGLLPDPDVRDAPDPLRARRLAPRRGAPVPRAEGAPAPRLRDLRGDRRRARVPRRAGRREAGRSGGDARLREGDGLPPTSASSTRACAGRLYFDNRMQGYAPVRGGVALSLNYTDGLALSLAFAPRARRVVVIGLGAGMFPSLLSRHAPELETTSIEIDPEVVAVARKYFAFAPDANDRVLVGDGRRDSAARWTAPTSSSWTPTSPTACRSTSSRRSSTSSARRSWDPTASSP